MTHKRWTPEQVAIWTKTRDSIAAEPLAYDQDVVARGTPTCNTPSCILGWASWHAFGEWYRWDLQTALGLSDHEEDKVFTGDGIDWAFPFDAEMDKAETREEEAAIAVRYINHILRTGRV